MEMVKVKIRKPISRKKKWIYIGIAALGMSLLACNTRLNSVHYSIQSKKVSDEITIALIADLHSCDYGDGQERLLSQIDKEQPDLILLGGDIVDDKLPEDHAWEFLAAVAKRYPCFYVSGNHEFRSGSVGRMKKTIQGLGIPVLEGDNIAFAVEGQTIMVSGIDDPEVGEGVFRNQLEACGSKLNKEQFSLLLSHRPERIEAYRSYDFDLILTGHAHGGQWRIPGILNGLLAPHQGFFPKYAGGLYEFDRTSMVVSRGLAKESTRIPRIFNRPEVVIVHVLPYKS